MSIHVELDDETISLPTKMEVCPRCQGRGVHDCWEGGMTSEQMNEMDPDFFEDYMSGVYDTRCEECKGRNVIEVVDRVACGYNPKLMEALVRYERQQEELAEMHAMQYAEMRAEQWGARMLGLGGYEY